MPAWLHEAALRDDCSARPRWVESGSSHCVLTGIDERLWIDYIEVMIRDVPNINTTMVMPLSQREADRFGM
jgi:hypothetical protein